MVYAPTVLPAHKFHALDDVHAIKKAMKGSGCEEGPIVNVLAKRCIKQRVQIAKIYKKEYGRELADDLKKELGGDLEMIMVALTYSYFEYLARELATAFKGIGCKERVIMEIVLTRFNSELKLTKDIYAEVCGGDLDADLASEMSGDCGKLLSAVLSGSRDETDKPDLEKAKEQAQNLYDAGEKKLGTNEAVFRDLFAHQSFPQINAIAKEYDALSKKSLAEAIKSEMSGSFRDALLIVLRLAQNRIEYYADSLYESVHGAGTDERSLIRVVITRSELDLAAIKTKYHEKRGKTLEHAIEKDTSGAFRNALLAIARS